MAAAHAVSYMRLGGWIGRLEEVVEHMNGVVQVVVICFADGNVDLSAKLRSESLPVLLENHAKVVFLPVIDDRLIDNAGLWIPQRNGPAAGTARTVRRVPGAPLLTGHRPTVAGAHDVFHLTFVPDSELHLAIDIAFAGTFGTTIINVG